MVVVAEPQRMAIFLALLAVLEPLEIYQVNGF